MRSGPDAICIHAVVRALHTDGTLCECCPPVFLLSACGRTLLECQAESLTISRLLVTYRISVSALSLIHIFPQERTDVFGVARADA